MSSLTCAEVEEALPALALGALDEDERTAVTGHISACPGCRAQLAQYAAVSRGLLQAVPQRVAPPAIRQALMERLNPHRPSWGERIGSWLRGAQVLPHWAFGVTAAFVLAVIGALGAETIHLANQQDALAAQIRQQQAALAVVAGSSTESINMTGTQVAMGATAWMRFDPENSTAVMQAVNLPALPTGKAYQLWLIYPDGKRDSGAVFTVPADSNGKVTLVVMAPKPLKNYVRCGVSIEPSGGSPWPTGPAALTGKLWS